MVDWLVGSAGRLDGLVERTRHTEDIYLSCLTIILAGRINLTLSYRDASL